MPAFAGMFLLFTMANIAIPGTSAFVGELMIFRGIWGWSLVATLFATSGLVLGGAYSLWLLNRVIYGNVKTTHLRWYSDLTRDEKLTRYPLAFLTIFLGVYPEPILYFREDPVNLTVTKVRLSPTYAV
jgi:NADH-quinone oxidoreductase subunit M